MFKIIAKISGCSLRLTKKKQKISKGLVYVRVVHLSCPTGLSPWTGGQCFLHHLIPW